MRKTIFIYILIILSIPIYSQENKTAKQYANEIGINIMCDSTGLPFHGVLTIVDSTYGGIKGWCCCEILTQEDSIHVKNVKFIDFHERGETLHDSTVFGNPTFVECMQKYFQNKLYNGYIVYPDRQPKLTRYIWSFRIAIEKRDPGTLDYSNDE